MRNDEIKADMIIYWYIAPGWTVSQVRDTFCTERERETDPHIFFNKPNCFPQIRMYAKLFFLSSHSSEITNPFTEDFEFFIHIYLWV